MKAILRKIDTGQHQSFSVHEDVHPYLYNHWHYHPEVELTLIRKGSGTRLVGDSMERFDDGDLILLGANLPHLWRSDPVYFEGRPDLAIEAVAVHFREDFWGKDFLGLPEMQPLRTVLNRARRGLKLYGATRRRVARQMEAMLSGGPVTRLASLLHVLDIIAQSGEYRLLASPGFTSAYDLVHTDSINAIYNYTLDRFQHKITIREIAAIANVSPHSFCRYFKSRTLKTYWQFLLEVRIGYACKLLMARQGSISQVCFACGFNNLSNFNRQFKAITGHTPTAYLREHTRMLETL